jgi:SAM-dependent methyltransferase
MRRLWRESSATSAGPADTVLDVACGPGIVVCAFARAVQHATGIDLTPAMLERARALAASCGLFNVSWQVGDVEALPFADQTFSIVVSRLAFHHLERPAAVLAEMSRVCRPGGVVAVVDLLSPPDPARATALNQTERLRDPSHVRALTRVELGALFPEVGLPAPQVTDYRLELELESWLARSFPDPQDVEEIRRRFIAALADDGLGLGTHREGDSIRFAYDVAICASRLPT